MLIEIARLAIDQLAADAPSRLDERAANLACSASTLLQRLGLYAYARQTSHPAEPLLARVAEERWLQNSALRRELYAMLAVHFPRGAEPSRAAFISALQAPAAWEGVSPEYAARARYDLAQHLYRFAPESEAARTFSEAEQRAHGDWSPEPDDEVLHLDHGWRLGTSPITLEQLLEWEPADAVEQIETALAETTAWGSGQALLDTIHQAAAAAPSWATTLIAHTVSDASARPQIAQAALWGLRESEATDAEKIAFLHRIATDAWTPEVVQPVSAVLEKWSGNLDANAAPALLDALDAAADAVYARAAAARPNVEGQGWVESAINHPAGRAAHVWWRVANARDRAGGQFVLSLDDAERARWHQVLDDDSGAGDNARPILGMALDRLSMGDSPWTHATIFPSFDPFRDRRKAAQLWDGRLAEQRWSWSAMEGLRPYFESLFAVSRELVPFRSKQLGEWVALLATAHERSGLTVNMLEHFISGASDEARVAFSQALPTHLNALTPDSRARLWREVLAPYWHDRNTNMPIPLAPAEVREMVSWVTALPEVADDAVTVLYASPGERIEHADHVLWQWNQDAAWPQAHPAEAVRLVAFLCERHCVTRWSADHAVTVLSVCMDAGAPREPVRRAVEALVALGSESARQLLQRLDEE